ncbi:MAG: argininosuccinate synthase domain-containing protein, partial [Exilispira sp.]
MKFKVGLAFSGGIDSTFAAIYLKEMGYDVVAFNFPIGRNVDNLIYDTAKKLKIKLEIIDIRKIFEQVIKEDFYKSYLTGLTPNPCVRCNRYIKFGVLYNIVKNRYHMDFLATGHYAKIYKDENQRFFIKKAFDKDKDQSYFLWQINRLILKDIIFPLGNIKKSEIKSILLQSGFHEIAKKVESFDICFVNEQSYKRYIEKFGVQSSNKEGYFVDQKGNIVGKHQGIY